MKTSLVMYFSTLLSFVIFFAQPSISMAEEGTLKWSFTADLSEHPNKPVGSLGDMNSHPTIARDGTIYIATNNPARLDSDIKNYLYSINSDGILKWKRDIKHVDTPVTSPDGTIYFVSPLENKLYAVNQDNSLAWDFDFTNSDLVNPKYYIGNLTVGADRTIYIVSEVRSSSNVLDCNVYCSYSHTSTYIGVYLHAINPDGTEKWKKELPSGLGTDGFIAIDNETIYLLRSGSFFAISNDGTIKWEITEEEELRLWNFIIGNDGYIYGMGLQFIYDNNGEADVFYGIYKIDKHSKDITLLYDIGYYYSGVSPLVIGENHTIYFRSRENRSYKLNAIGTNGKLKWQTTLNDNLKYIHDPDDSPAISSDGTIFVTADDGYLYAINPDGTKRWEFYTGDRYLTSSPAIGNNGTIYIGSTDRLYAINSESGSLASTPWPMFLQNPQHTNASMLTRATALPVPDIKVNGQDGIVNVSSESSVSITVSLDSFDYLGQNADWWIFAETPFGTFSWQVLMGWRPGIQGTFEYPYPLINFPSYNILDIQLPSGEYKLHFALDSNVDGIKDETWSDSVQIIVE